MLKLYVNKHKFSCMINNGKFYFLTNIIYILDYILE